MLVVFRTPRYHQEEAGLDGWGHKIVAECTILTILVGAVAAGVLS